MNIHKLIALLLALAFAPSFALSLPDVDLISIGRSIYRDGVLPNGQKLVGMRANSETVTGSAAACSNCHRNSGLGSVEGQVAVPPITGRALFGGADNAVIVRQDRRFNPGLSTPHSYTEESFAQALRAGNGAQGRELDKIMPRFDLSDEQVKGLSAYIKTLSVDRSPGAFDDEIHVATVITEGVDPQRKRALLSTMNTLLAQINGNTASSVRQKMSAIDHKMHNHRRVILKVWELQGASSTWKAQLDERNAVSPVFAVVSGLTDSTWQPVQDFCETTSVVCWFPSINLIPSGAEHSKFSLYFNAGMATEAKVVASRLQKNTNTVQIVGKDALARTAAAELSVAYPSVKTVDIEKFDASKLSGLMEKDNLVAWLNPQELAALDAIKSTKATLYLSSSLDGDMPAIAEPLKDHTFIVQPLEMGMVRDANLQRFDNWLSGSKVSLVDRRMQSEAYFAVRSLVATMRGLLNNLHTEYLIERAEGTLSMQEAMQVQDEIQSLMMAPVSKRPPKNAASTDAELAAIEEITAIQKLHLEAMRKRGGTTVYPRLSLAPGQRFASKGAYITPLGKLSAQTSIRDADWVVP